MWEEESEKEEEEDWLPAARSRSGSIDKDLAPPSASAVAAMARPSSSRAAVAKAVVVAAAGAGGSSLQQPVSSELCSPPAAGPSTPQGTAAAAAAAAATVEGPADEEEELRGDEEWEWVYPRTSGEAPGARGYHSAAVSEDGMQVGHACCAMCCAAILDPASSWHCTVAALGLTLRLNLRSLLVVLCCFAQVWIFGGIAASGACDTLAVLDVATWQFRCGTHSCCST